MAKLLDFINVPAARASIIWLIGEYNEKVPLIAPDVLRKMAKSFIDEEDIVKLQVLNLGVKLYLTNSTQTSLLCQYVFTLARYDPNYDVRDRARFLRQFIFPASGEATILSKNAQRVFLSVKPAPALDSKYRDRTQFQLGSLSHYLNMRAVGYTDLPQFPTVAPDSSVRNTSMYETPGSTGAFGDSPLQRKEASSSQKHSEHTGRSGSIQKDNEFYSNSDKNSNSNDESSSSSGSYSESSSSSESDAGEGNAKQSNQQNKKATNVVTNAMTETKSSPSTTTTTIIKPTMNDKNSGIGTSDSESSSYASSNSSSGSGNEDSSSEEASGSNSSDKRQQNDKNSNESQDSKSGDSSLTKTQNVPPSKDNLSLLLDLDDIPPMGPIMTPSLGGFLTPSTPMTAARGMNVGLLPQNVANSIELVGPSYTEFNYKELLNKVTGHGLQVNYRFTRSPHLFSSSMVSIELQFINQSTAEILDIHMGQKTLPAGMQLNEFAPVQKLLPQQTATTTLGIDFNDSTHAIEFEILSSGGKSRLTLKPPVGELIRSVRITNGYFKEQRTKLRGMNEHQSCLNTTKDSLNDVTLKKAVFACINVDNISNNLSMTNNSASGDAGNDEFYFVGQTMSSKSLVLITLDWKSNDEKLIITVNCEKMVIGSMVLNDLRNALSTLKPANS